MALAQTELPELKRFTFFVSRRFEEGRERFRLHMGFFASQAEAEEWLSVVRDIYPGAWAGEAPGKRLRARAAEAAAAQAQHAVGPQPKAASAPPPQALPPRPAARVQSTQAVAPVNVLARVPTLHPPAKSPAPAAVRQATSPMTRGTPQSGRSPGLPSAAAARPPQPQQPRPGAATAGGMRPSPKAAAGRPAAAPLAARPAPARPAPAATARPAPQAPPSRIQQQAKKPLFEHSNVKEVLAALDGQETGATRLMPAPAAARGAVPADDSTLTDTQVLRFLEARREEGGPGRLDPAAESGISLLKPDDTGTRRALKEAVSRDEPVSFAVQLLWSVQPVALEQVPPLAIFSAYTLYSVEGSREGRKWYGLRLGFFNDVISAKQVAYYVRSEFASVAVVPVSAKERERATEDNRRFAGAAAPRKRRESEDNEFKLIDEEPASPPAPDRNSRMAASSPSSAVSESPDAVAARPLPQRSPPTASSAASRQATTRAARKGAGKVGARERRTPQTLEETLEILGANELAIDNGSESLSDTGVRHLRVEIQKNTPFSRLLERLSERVRKA